MDCLDIEEIEECESGIAEGCGCSAFPHNNRPCPVNTVGGRARGRFDA